MNNNAQSIVWGVENLNSVLGEITSKKVLLVVDASFPFLPIKAEIEAMRVPYVVFDDFTPNPLYEDVCKGVKCFLREGCDTIVAVGGGSSIDVAKCIKLYCRMSDEKIFLEQEYDDSGVPLIAIPTTAGTGSESTRYAVIYYQGKKQSVTHDSILPNIAILDPKVLTTLPPYQKRSTVLDAYCQAIESWWSVNSTEQSRELSRRALEILEENMDLYILGTQEADQNAKVVESIMRAANLAGQAINITQTTAPHAMSYKLTSLFHIPHGHAVALCLPEVWDYMLRHLDRCVDPRGSEYLSNVFGEIAQVFHCSNAKECIDVFKNHIRLYDLQQPVSNDREEDLDVLTQSVNPVRLKNNPISLDQDVLRGMYERIVLPTD